MVAGNSSSFYKDRCLGLTRLFKIVLLCFLAVTNLLIEYALVACEFFFFQWVAEAVAGDLFHFIMIGAFVLAHNQFLFSLGFTLWAEYR